MGALVFEIDTAYNMDKHDGGDNHIGIMTMGKGAVETSHSKDLGMDATLPFDLTDGAFYTLKIRYINQFDPELADPKNCSRTQSCGKMRLTQHFSDFVQGNVGTSSFDGPTSGTLKVWLERNVTGAEDDAECGKACDYWTSVAPRIITPINMFTFFDLKDDTSMHVGVTGSTKLQAWQTQKIHKLRLCDANRVGTQTTYIQHQANGDSRTWETSTYEELDAALEENGA